MEAIKSEIQSVGSTIHIQCFTVHCTHQSTLTSITISSQGDQRKDESCLLQAQIEQRQAG